VYTYIFKPAELWPHLFGSSAGNSFGELVGWMDSPAKVVVIILFISSSPFECIKFTFSSAAKAKQKPVKTNRLRFLHYSQSSVNENKAYDKAVILRIF